VRAVIALLGVLAVVLIMLLAVVHLASLADDARSAVTAASAAMSPSGAPGADPWLPPAAVAALFADPAAHREPGVERLEVVDLAPLDVPTGRVVAGDVFLADAPIDRALRPGRHPVRVLLAHLDQGGGAVVAAAALGEAGRATGWVSPDREIDAGEAGYPVDSGTAAFQSEGLPSGEASEARWQAILDALKAGYDKGELWAALDADDGGASVVAFASGYGDGWYPLWLGVDAAGQPVALLTEFGVLRSTP
jgi:hypothetical protein